MRNERQNMNTNMFPFPGMMPTNMMMFPNYMNDNCSNFDNRITNLEKKVKMLENKVQRLENPYGTNNNMEYQTNANQAPYQSTQNNTGYNGDMYMM